MTSPSVAIMTEDYLTDWNADGVAERFAEFDTALWWRLGYRALPQLLGSSMWKKVTGRTPLSPSADERTNRRSARRCRLGFPPPLSMRAARAVSRHCEGTHCSSTDPRNVRRCAIRPRPGASSVAAHGRTIRQGSSNERCSTRATRPISKWTISAAVGVDMTP